MRFGAGAAGSEQLLTSSSKGRARTLAPLNLDDASGERDSTCEIVIAVPVA
jgi:hypothetical protein